MPKAIKLEIIRKIANLIFTVHFIVKISNLGNKEHKKDLFTVKVRNYNSRVMKINLSLHLVLTANNVC